MTDQIKNALHRAEAKSLVEPTPNDGPALYQDSGAYLAGIDQRLAEQRDMRAYRTAFDKKERAADIKDRIAIGLGIVGVSALLVASHGGPNRIFKNIKSLPQHIAYLYEGHGGGSPGR